MRPLQYKYTSDIFWLLCTAKKPHLIFIREILKYKYSHADFLVSTESAPYIS